MNLCRVKTILVAWACFTVIVGCSNEEDAKNQEEKESANEKIHIVTTFYPMYEFTKNITKDKAQVDLLIPSNIEPHEWQPTPKDMAAIQQADFLVYNSPFMETWIFSIQESLDKDGPLFIEASERIPLLEGTEEESNHDNEESDHHDEDHKQLDPHVWLSPVLAQKEVQTITDAIVKQDPENKDYYKRNSEDYIQQLKELDELYRTTLHNVSSKEMITQHAAFGYLAKEYGLTQVPIAGLSPSEDPSPAKLAELKEFAKEHQIDVVYFEETTSPKVAQTLAGELGTETEVLNTLEGLSKEDQEKGLSYIEVMKNNLKSLEKYFVKK
ncbi:metal ABC transporter substrate-binding protein [Peribacillus frigoritolerans]|uniref:metal ABC transporter substrate-binding protein n=1 Tax=Peribacillus frigoritolerans TaxID=450367 RepID=UPI0022262F92|nr:metal ABC transporter substrate-binding protein [Peribacillus frigoritolerans]UYZ00886.1 metal ABC transporter substrate-binding protein [Peribacillus frigoritolerans]